MLQAGAVVSAGVAFNCRAAEVLFRCSGACKPRGRDGHVLELCRFDSNFDDGERRRIS